MNEAVMRAQGYAVSIEHSMSKVFHCDRSGIGGLVNSDYIRKHPYAAICCALTAIYAVDFSKREQIEKFIVDFMFYSDWSIDDVLSFDTNKKVEGKVEYEIDYENGEAAITDMISKFDALI